MNSVSVAAANSAWLNSVDYRRPLRVGGVHKC